MFFYLPQKILSYPNSRARFRDTQRGETDPVSRLETLNLLVDHYT